MKQWARNSGRIATGVWDWAVPAAGSIRRWLRRVYSMLVSGQEPEPSGVRATVRVATRALQAYDVDAVDVVVLVPAHMPPADQAEAAGGIQQGLVSASIASTVRIIQDEYLGDVTVFVFPGEGVRASEREPSVHSPPHAERVVVGGHVADAPARRYGYL